MKRIDWQGDLDQLALELPKLHKNLFHACPEDSFYNGVRSLKKRAEGMDVFSLLMELARIIAAIRDAHTAVVLPRFNRLPFECCWFKEGIYVTSASPPLASPLLHSKILSLNGIPIADVIERVSSIISHENRSFLMSQLPEYLVCAEVLYGLGISDEFERIEIGLEAMDGQSRVEALPTLKYADWETNRRTWVTAAKEALPLYRQNPFQYYWYHWLAEEKLMYVNYNHCKDMPGFTVADFSQRLIMELQVKEDEVEKLVIDLRHNGGGNSELFRGFLAWLSQSKRLNRRDKLRVIVGRHTFSSALLNAFYLRFHTQAIFLGEPTGGKPNHYGEVKYLTLKSSGLGIRYSTQYYPLVEDEDDDLPSLMPDVLCEVTFRDYIRNSDPCLDWILGEK